MHTPVETVLVDYETGWRVKTTTIGSGKKKIVCFPGGPGLVSRYMLNGLNRLAKEYQIWVLGLPEHEVPLPVASPISLSGVASAYSRILKRIGALDAFCMMGHSFGGWAMNRVIGENSLSLSVCIHVSPLSKNKKTETFLQQERHIKVKQAFKNEREAIAAIMPLYFKNRSYSYEWLLDPAGITCDYQIDLGDDILSSNFTTVRMNCKHYYLIGGDHDLIAGSHNNDHLFSSMFDQVIMSPQCGHFPMLERTELFSKSVEMWVDS